MRLEHIALSINSPSEITRFYQNILGLQKQKEFTLSKDLSSAIFCIESDTTVFLMKKDHVVFELFITTEDIVHNFRHVCISVENREIMVNHAIRSSYDVTRIKREFSDLIFIKDKTGNIFEIKEMLN